MADERSNGRSAELVYLSEPSWYPVLVAAGIAAIVASVFTWWPYGAIGAIVVLTSLVAWVRQARSAYDQLPREQRVTLGRIPATHLRRKR